MLRAAELQLTIAGGNRSSTIVPDARERGINASPMSASFRPFLVSVIVVSAPREILKRAHLARGSATPAPLKPTSLVTFLFGDKKVTCIAKSFAKWYQFRL